MFATLFPWLSTIDIDTIGVTVTPSFVSVISCDDGFVSYDSRASFMLYCFVFGTFNSTSYFAGS